MGFVHSVFLKTLLVFVISNLKKSPLIAWQDVNMYGGFQLEFVSMSRFINHMTCYKLECSHWWKIHFKKNPLQDLLSSLNAVMSTNETN